MNGGRKSTETINVTIDAMIVWVKSSVFDAV